MALNEEMLHTSNPPHIHSGESIPKIMWTAAGALTPACAYSVHLFGAGVLILIIVSVIAAVVAEALMQLILKRPVTAYDGSAAVTGLLLAMIMPPQASPWMAAVGSFFAIIVVKQLFGGLGLNIFNPALSARALLTVFWPEYMTTTWQKISETNVLSSFMTDTFCIPYAAIAAPVRDASPSLMQAGHNLLSGNSISPDRLYDMVPTPELLRSLLIGNAEGLVGETSVILLLAGALILFFRKIISWHIPVFFFGTVAAFTAVYYSIAGVPAFYRMVVFHCLSGGLFLGAFFMATDPVTSPVSSKGMVVFGIGCGLITCILRFWGGNPDGAAYAILLMNAFVPVIDRYIKPRVFGTGRGGRVNEKG